MPTRFAGDAKLGHMPYEEKPRESHFYNLEERKIWGVLTFSSGLKAAVIKMETGSLLTCNGRTRVNGCRSKQIFQ